MELPEIDRLLRADEANVQTMRQFMADVSHELPKLLNEADALYVTCCHAFGQRVSEIFPATVPDETVIERLQTMQVRGLLLAQIGVLYAMAVADFLRMRVTAPLLNVRLQCESLALMKLMRQNPSVGKEWRAIQTDDEGRRFFGKHQKRVRTILNSYELASAYDRSSGMALHSRFIQLARRFRSSQREESQRNIQKQMILAQEFDPEHPHYFLVEVLFVLRVQAHILAHIPDAAPEITNPILLETRIPRFLEGIARLDEDWKRRFSKLLTQGGQPDEQTI